MAWLQQALPQQAPMGCSSLPPQLPFPPPSASATTSAQVSAAAASWATLSTLARTRVPSPGRVLEVGFLTVTVLFQSWVPWRLSTSGMKFSALSWRFLAATTFHLSVEGRIQYDDAHWKKSYWSSRPCTLV